MELGYVQVSNADFAAAVFSHLPDGAVAVICSKGGDSVRGIFSIQSSRYLEQRLPRLWARQTNILMSKRRLQLSFIEGENRELTDMPAIYGPVELITMAIFFIKNSRIMGVESR